MEHTAQSPSRPQRANTADRKAIPASNNPRQFEDKPIFTDRERKWPYRLMGMEKFGFSIVSENTHTSVNLAQGTSLEGATFVVQRMNFEHEDSVNVAARASKPARTHGSTPIVRSYLC